MLVLSRDELKVLEVGGLLGLLVLALVEAEANLEDGEVCQWDDSGGNRDHDLAGLAVVVHVVDGREGSGHAALEKKNFVKTKVLHVGFLSLQRSSPELPEMKMFFSNCWS